MNRELSLPPSWMGRQTPLSVALVGAGGNGCEMAIRLAKLATVLRALDDIELHVTIYDGDRVTASNIGRQAYYRPDIGQYKAVMLTHRLCSAYELTWRAVTAYATPNELVQSAYDLVVTCVDKALFRAALGRSNPHRRLLWLDLGNGAMSGNVILGHLGGAGGDASTYIPNVYDLYPSLADMDATDREEPSCSTAEALRRQALPVNAQCADLALELLYFLLRDRRLAHHGYQYRLNPTTVTPLPCSDANWAMFGYRAPGGAATAPQAGAKARKRARR